MQTEKASAPFQEFVASGYLRGLAIFALVVTLFLAFIAWMAWWVEDAVLGLWSMPIWLAMVGYWVWQWRLWAKRIRLYTDRLEIITPGASLLSAKLGEITGQRLGRGRLHLECTQTTHTITGEANMLASLAAALEARIPALRAAQPHLPIQIDAPRQPVIIANVAGLLIGGMGVALGGTAFGDVELPNRIAAMLFAVAMILLPVVTLYWLLLRFVWRYSFDNQEIRLHTSVRTTRYDPSKLRSITMQQRKETTRGFTKTLYWLRLGFVDGSHLLVQPAAQNYPYEYDEHYEQVSLTTLLAQLNRLYAEQLNGAPAVPPPPPTPAVTRRELSPQSGLPPNADYGYELTSHPADLRVTVINFGERQPGAEDVIIRLSRPVLDVQEFDTTNGSASFSDSGAYLLVSQPFHLIAIDAHTLQAWHYDLPNRTMLISSGWEGKKLLGKMLAYGKATREAETIGPFSWEELMQKWKPGLPIRL